MARKLFIYWKTARSHAAQAEAATRQLQHVLCTNHPGLVARLYRQADGQGDMLTLMETYAHPPQGVSAALQQAVHEAALRALAGMAVGERHTEVFEDAG